MQSWTPSPQYTVDLGRPLRERFDVIDAETVARACDMLEAIRSEMPAGVLKLARLVDLRTGFSFHREARAFGRLTGVDWRWLMIANVSYSLVLTSMACSTVALATPDGPVVARNMDWWPEDKLAAASCTLGMERGGKLQYALAGWPGAMGAVTGLSGRGFAIVLNAVLSEEKPRKTGYPVLLFLRKVLQNATNFDHAVRMLSGRKLIMSGLFTVVGTANDQRVCIERTPTRAKLRQADDDGPLVTTNRYIAFDDAGRDTKETDSEDFFDCTCSRYENLLRLAGAIGPDMRGDSAALLTALTDETVRQEITAQHVIMQPRTNRIELYVPSQLLEPHPPAG